MEDQLVDEADRSATVYRAIRESLLDHRYPPGTQLNIREMASQLGVSATPVREALIRLAAEEIVAAIEHRGYFVRPLLIEELVSELELCQVLLIYALRSHRRMLAHGFVEGAKLGIGNGPLANAAAPFSVERVLSDLEAMYEAVAELTCNENFVELIRQANERLRRVRLLDLEREKRRAKIARQIDEIVCAVSEARFDDAEAALLHHIESSQAKVPRLVKEGNAQALGTLDYTLSRPGVDRSRPSG